MKTPSEWMEEWFPAVDASNWPIVFTKAHIEAIQRDALNSPFANTTDQEELEMARTARDAMQHECRRLSHNIEVYRERWHQARRYLRQANKGAERNNQVMRLQSYDISQLRERIKQLEQANQ